MCQRNTVTENIPVVTRTISSETPSVDSIVQLTETQRREEIDWRVINKLAERDYIKQQYMRGFLDCIYVIAFIAWVALLVWQYYGKEE